MISLRVSAFLRHTKINRYILKFYVGVLSSVEDIVGFADFKSAEI